MLSSHFRISLTISLKNLYADSEKCSTAIEVIIMILTYSLPSGSSIICVVFLVLMFMTKGCSRNYPWELMAFFPDPFTQDKKNNTPYPRTNQLTGIPHP